MSTTKEESFREIRAKCKAAAHAAVYGTGFTMDNQGIDPRGVYHHVTGGRDVTDWTPEPDTGCFKIPPDPQPDRIERAARAIVTRLGYDPDAMATLFKPLASGKEGVMIVPSANVQRPLWTFYVQEAVAAMEVLDL